MSRLRRFVATLAIAAALLGCSTRLPPPTERISPTSRPPEPPTEAVSYSPDSMWAFLATTPDQLKGTQSLAEAADLAQVVVVGRYAGVEEGDGYGPPGEAVGWYAVALIEPISILKGAPATDERGYMRVPFMLVIGGSSYPEQEFANLTQSLPRDRALLFLSSWAAHFERAETVVPDWLSDLATPDQYKTIGGDGAFRVSDGRLMPLAGVDGWPEELRDADLDDVADQIRARP